MKRLKSIVFIIALMVLLAAASVSADSGSISLHVTEGPAGMTFKLYKIGDFDQAKGELKLCEPYASYGVDLEDKNSAAQLLCKYIARDGIKPDQKSETDAEGDVAFGDLELGFYLLAGDSFTDTKANVRYDATPALMTVPYWDTNGELIYDIMVPETKVRSTILGIPTKINVQKIWENDEGMQRPKEVTVQLLKDGLADTDREDYEVALSAENNWTYTWEELDNDNEWSVLEKDVPDPYKVSVDTKTETTKDRKQQEVQYVKVILKNTVPPPPPITITSEGTTTTTSLYQTGQLWWPVGILAAAGLLFILIGLIIAGRKKQ